MRISETLFFLVLASFAQSMNADIGATSIQKDEETVADEILDEDAMAKEDADRTPLVVAETLDSRLLSDESAEYESSKSQITVSEFAETELARADRDKGGRHYNKGERHHNRGRDYNYGRNYNHGRHWRNGAWWWWYGGRWYNYPYYGDGAGYGYTRSCFARDRSGVTYRSKAYGASASYLQGRALAKCRNNSQRPSSCYSMGCRLN